MKMLQSIMPSPFLSKHIPNTYSRVSLYDTGVTASFGDELLTLSTCDSSEQDGRVVVVAKRIKAE